MGVTIVGVGAGGIGYYLYEPLLKYLEYGGFEGDLIILDPDKIESKNLARQFGPWALDWNKARAMAKILDERVSPKKIRVTAVEQAVSPKTIAGFKRWFWKDGITVLACVDNHATRIFCQEEVSRLKDAIYLAGGNGEWDGQVQVYVRQNRRDILPPIHHVHPEMEAAPGRFPDDVSCQVAAESQPQIVWANMQAACTMGSVLASLLKREKKDSIEFNEVLFDTGEHTQDPVLNEHLTSRRKS